MQIVSIIFGIGAMLALFSIYQQKTRKGIILSKLSADVCWVIHYLCIGGIAGHFEEGTISQVSVIGVDISLEPDPITSPDYYEYDPYGIGLVAGTVGGTEPASGTEPYSPPAGHEVNYYQSGCLFTDSTLSSGSETPYPNQPRYLESQFGTVRNTQENSNYRRVSPENVVVVNR